MSMSITLITATNDSWACFLQECRFNKKIQTFLEFRHESNNDWLVQKVLKESILWHYFFQCCLEKSQTWLVQNWTTIQISIPTLRHWYWKIIKQRQSEEVQIKYPTIRLLVNNQVTMIMTLAVCINNDKCHKFSS